MGALEEPIKLDVERPVDVARQFMTAVSVGVQVLNTRLLTLLVLVGGVALFGVAVALPDWVRTASAALYAVLVIVPVLRWGK